MVVKNVANSVYMTRFCDKHHQVHAWWKDLKNPNDVKVFESKLTKWPKHDSQNLAKITYA